MNNEAERPLSFRERQQLFNAQLNLGAPNDVPIPRHSPRLPPRNSIHNGTSATTNEKLATSSAPALPARNSIVRDSSPLPPSLPSRNSLVEDPAPVLPPRRPSLCVEPSHEVCEEPRPHVSTKRSTRRAVRVKKSPTMSRGSVSDRSSSPGSDTSTIRRVPARAAPDPPSAKDDTLKKSPSTIRRASNSSPSSRSETLKNSPNTIRRCSRSPSPRSIKSSLTIGNAVPPPITTPPPKSPSTIRRVRDSSPAPVAHRQSLPASHMIPPPDLPARRHSYDERLEVDAQALLSRTQGSLAYSYARPTGLPPPKPSNQAPFTIERAPQSMTMKLARALKNSAVYKIDEPPEVNLSTHPKFRDDSPGRSSPAGRF